MRRILAPLAVGTLFGGASFLAVDLAHSHHTEVEWTLPDSASAANGASPETLDISVVPEHLPAAVGAVAAESAVQVFYGNGFNDEAPPTTDMNGKVTVKVSPLLSGVLVKVGDDKVLATAGHGFFDRHGSPYAWSCGDLLIMGKEGADSVSGRPSDLATEYAPRTGIDDFQPDAYKDITVMNVPHTFPLMEKLAGAEMRQTPIQEGEPVFFYNYQDYDSKTPRNIQTDQPAVTGGVVLNSHNEAGFVEVLTGFKDYLDPNVTEFVSSGASGGPVFDADGKLVGITLLAEKYPMPEKTIEKHEAVRIVRSKNEHTGREYGIAMFLPVTSEEFKVYMGKALSGDDSQCIPKIQKNWPVIQRDGS
jgi:hypothetical protein